MKFFKNAILSLKTRILLKKIKSFSFDYKEIKKVCIVIDSNYNFIEKLEEIFKRKKIEIIFITKQYSIRENKVFNYINGYDYTKKDFKITGRLSFPFLSFLESISCDLLISLIKNETIEERYILSKVISKLRLGINAENYEIYDVVIKNNKEDLTVDFIEDTLNYLKNITK